jgi:hypothetical protein
MTTQPDDKSEGESSLLKPATQEDEKAEKVNEPAKEEELEFQTEEEIEAESEMEAQGKTPRELYKKIKRQLKGVMEYIGQMRGLERANRKWLEKRLVVLEEEVLEVRMEMKSFKALYKKEKEKGDK